MKAMTWIIYIHLIHMVFLKKITGLIFLSKVYIIFQGTIRLCVFYSFYYIFLDISFLAPVSTGTLDDMQFVILDLHQNRIT